MPEPFQDSILQHPFDIPICYGYRMGTAAGEGGVNISGRRLIGPDCRMVTIDYKLAGVVPIDCVLNVKISTIYTIAQ